MSVADVVPGPVTVEAVMLLAAYRRWCGMPPLAAGAPPATTPDEVWVYRTLASEPFALSRPLALTPQGIWDPTEAYWGEAGDDDHPLVRQMIDAGPRPAFEMEQVIPGVADDDWDVDPVADAAELHRAGADREASRILKNLIAQDDRCIDAWVHLGNIAFDKRGPTAAWELYDTAVAIGEQTISAGFAGVLPREFADNRPYHRALYGLGLCAWRKRRWQDAENIFRSRVWLDGSGGWGVLSCLDQVVAHRRWTKD